MNTIRSNLFGFSCCCLVTYGATLYGIGNLMSAVAAKYVKHDSTPFVRRAVYSGIAIGAVWAIFTASVSNSS